MASSARARGVAPDSTTGLLQLRGSSHVGRQPRLEPLGRGRPLFPFQLRTVGDVVAHDRSIKKGPLPTAALRLAAGQILTIDCLVLVRFP